jgi:endogenous inhibitor of DNA gyrase (YacG/DUF329 family)
MSAATDTSRHPRPPCPHCRKRVSYLEALNDGHECPHCGKGIVWSVPFGALSAKGFTRSKGGPSWRTLR